MSRALFVLGLAASFVSGAFGQETVGPAGVPHAENPPPAGVTYIMEMKILEGKGLVSDTMHGDLNRPEPSMWRPQPPISDRAADNAPPIMPSPQAPHEVSDAESSVTSEPEGIPKRQWEELPKMRGVQVLAAPKVAFPPNEPATVQISTQQSFSYLEPVEHRVDDSARPKTYEVKHSPFHELGLTITLEVEPVAGDNRFVNLSRFEVQVSSLDGREPVEGIEDLDVGRPVVSKRSLETTTKVRLGEIRLIPIPSGPKTEAVVLLRINQSTSR